MDILGPCLASVAASLLFAWEWKEIKYEEIPGSAYLDWVATQFAANEIYQIIDLLKLWNEKRVVSWL